VSEVANYAKVRQISVSETIDALTTAELYRTRNMLINEILIGISQASITLGVSLNATTDAVVSEAVSKTLTKNISETINATSTATITIIEQPGYAY
jgi:hypothetical protein